VIQNPGFLPDHSQSWITCSFCYSRHSLKVAEKSFHNFLSYLDTDRQTNSGKNITSLVIRLTQTFPPKSEKRPPHFSDRAPPPAYLKALLNLKDLKMTEQIAFSTSCNSQSCNLMRQFPGPALNKSGTFSRRILLLLCLRWFRSWRRACRCGCCRQSSASGVDRRGSKSQRTTHHQHTDHRHLAPQSSSCTGGRLVRWSTGLKDATLSASVTYKNHHPQQPYTISWQYYWIISSVIVIIIGIDIVVMNGSICAQGWLGGSISKLGRWTWIRDWKVTGSTPGQFAIK